MSLLNQRLDGEVFCNRKLERITQKSSSRSSSCDTEKETSDNLHLEKTQGRNVLCLNDCFYRGHFSALNFILSPLRE